MTDTNNTDGAALLPVTQADTELVAAIFEEFGALSGLTIEHIRRGLYNGDKVMQMVARHRQSHSLPGDVGIDNERKVILQNKRVNDAIQTALERGELTVSSDGYLAALTPSPLPATQEDAERSGAGDVDAVAKIIDPDAWHETLPTDGCGVYWIERRNKARSQAKAIAALQPEKADPGNRDQNKAGGLWYRRWHEAQTRVNELEASLSTPQRQEYDGEAVREAREAFGALLATHDEDEGMDDFGDDESVGTQSDADGANIRDLPLTFGILRRARRAYAALAHPAQATPSALSGEAGEGKPNGVAENKAGGLWYRRWYTAQTRVNELEALLANPPKHKFWGAGEPDCPREIKAPNGELHTLRCKVCGLDAPRNDLCRAALPSHKGAGE